MVLATFTLTAESRRCAKEAKRIEMHSFTRGEISICMSIIQQAFNIGRNFYGTSFENDNIIQWLAKRKCT